MQRLIKYSPHDDSIYLPSTFTCQAEPFRTLFPMRLELSRVCSSSAAAHEPAISFGAFA